MIILLYYTASVCCRIKKVSIQVDERHFYGDAQNESQHERTHHKRQIDHRRVHSRVVERRPREANMIYFDEIIVNKVSDVTQPA